MNPFSFGTVVKEPFYFDREKEKEQIVHVLSGGNNVVLYAPRRYGKTSLVMKVKEIIKSSFALSGLNIFSTEYAKKNRLSAQSTTQKAIAGLVNSCIIEKNGNDYFYSDPFFKLFILRLPA